MAMMSEPYSPFQCVLGQNDYQRSRAENFYKAEKNFLVELIRDELEAIENKRVDTVSIMRKRDAWTNVCDRFNSRFSDRPQRSVSQLKECWKKLKLKAKKEVDTLRHERFANPNGGGSAELATPGWLSIVITEMLYPNVNILDVMEDANDYSSACKGKNYSLACRLASNNGLVSRQDANRGEASSGHVEQQGAGGNGDAKGARGAAASPDDNDIDDGECPESKVDVSIITDNATEAGSTPDPESPTRPPSTSYASPLPLTSSDTTTTSHSSPASTSAYPAALRNLINDSSISCTILNSNADSPASSQGQQHSPKPSEPRSSSPATVSRNSPTTTTTPSQQQRSDLAGNSSSLRGSGTSRDPQPPPYSSIMRESALSVALRNPPLRESTTYTASSSASMLRRPSPIREVYSVSSQLPSRSRTGSPFLSLDATSFLTSIPNGSTVVSTNSAHALANGSRNSDCMCSSLQCKRKRMAGDSLTEYEQQMLAIAKEDALRKARLYDLQMEVLMLKKQKLLKDLSK